MVKDMNKNARNIRNLQYLEKVQINKEKYEIDTNEDLDNLTAFEKTLRNIEEKLVEKNHYPEIQVARYNGKCLPNYSDLLKYEILNKKNGIVEKNHDNKLSAYLNEARKDIASYKREYNMRLMSNTDQLLHTREGQLFAGDMLYININHHIH